MLADGDQVFFDATQPMVDGEYPIVYYDHEKDPASERKLADSFTQFLNEFSGYEEFRKEESIDDVLRLPLRSRLGYAFGGVLFLILLGLAIASMTRHADGAVGLIAGMALMIAFLLFLILCCMGGLPLLARGGDGPSPANRERPADRRMQSRAKSPTISCPKEPN